MNRRQAVLAVAATIGIGVGATTTAHLRPPVARPNVIVTPGAYDPTITQANIASTICLPGYTATVRNVSASVKQRVFTEYHVTPTPGAYEVDHLISLELGGSNDIRNLWPEPYGGLPPTAHDKDYAENRLHRDLCARRITLALARALILDPKQWHK